MLPESSPSSIRYNPMKFDNTFGQLPHHLFEEVHPTPLSSPRLIHVTKLKEELGLELEDQDLLLWLNGEKFLPGEQRISTRYAGHQFGVWAGQLGDGRAISLGEILNSKGRFEIQTKGSGLTPFSRMGDGKAVIRSSVREYLCSEAMSGLNIPTTRVLALVTGEDPVYRETVEKSALVARVFPSNLRFGHFELCYHFNKKDELRALTDYTLKNFFPNLTLHEMLQEVVRTTACLMASWQDVGFCHGVMNTDNMSVLGITIDYGPYGFLEDTHLNYVCNHSDHKGRYSYQQQPSVGMWNLERFLVCFIDLIPRESLQDIYNSYPAIFEQEYLRRARLKLGLLQENKEDHLLFIEVLQILSTHSIDYTFFWRKLCDYQEGVQDSMQELWDYYGNLKELKSWLEKYSSRLRVEESVGEDRKNRMKKHNPKYVLKNYIAQEVIEDVEKGSSKKLHDWLTIFYRPFDEHTEFESYSRPTPVEHKHYQVSCSS